MKPIFADDKAIELAADLLKQGRLVAFPTETVYGLGADASNPEAVKQIFKAKGRPADHPLIVHIPGIENLTDWAMNISDDALRLAERFWPGPLALILNKKPEVPIQVTGGQPTVALRIPNHLVAMRLLQAFGGGIAAPSANRFCRISPTQASHVSEELGDTIDLILDGGPCQVGVESTVIDFSGVKPALLRPGQITRAEIEAFLQTELMVNSGSTVRAPGMMAVHYAPSTIAMLCHANELSKIVHDLIQRDKKIGILSYHQKINKANSIQIISMPMQSDDYAQVLYAALRELDRLKLDIILIEQPPITENWFAINDRLAKATIAYQSKIIPIVSL
jgi:L-threonylcarbamoyladenylate synthase